MIRVYARKRGSQYRLVVSGHAEPGAARDAVCAGVSALTGSLVDFAASSPDCRHVRWQTERGEVFLSCRGGLGAGWQMVMRGLSLIAEQYPGSVRIESDVCS